MPSSGTMPLHLTVLPKSKLLCRCIQRADQPIILTGYAALNKLLGREVYTSHMQLGGPKASSQDPSYMHIMDASSHTTS